MDLELGGCGGGNGGWVASALLPGEETLQVCTHTHHGLSAPHCMIWEGKPGWAGGEAVCCVPLPLPLHFLPGQFPWCLQIFLTRIREMDRFPALTQSGAVTLASKGQTTLPVDSAAGSPALP